MDREAGYRVRNQPGTQFIVVVECSTGNGQVGQMWVETLRFDKNATLLNVADAIAQISPCGGRVMLTVSRPHPFGEPGRVEDR